MDNSLVSVEVFKYDIKRSNSENKGIIPTEMELVLEQTQQGTSHKFKIVMENPNHLNEPNEAVLEVNPVVPEPNQVENINDPNEMVDIPDDIELVDYDEEDPENNPEEEPKEDVDIELEDDAELIFPYKVEGDKTPPPGDMSSDLVSSKSESEDEEVNIAPEASSGTITQKPYVIRDFLRGLFEVGESYSARDSSNVDGLAPWALRRDLEASRARARVMEAELGCYRLIVMENPNHLNEPNEAVLEVNPVVPEPNQVANINDPNEMVDIPDDIELVDYDEEDPENNLEEEPKEDVDIELEDDAELIFPYKVEGDKTPPPGDMSSDLVSSKSESEDEEVNIAPEASSGTITQKPYVIRDFLRGLFEVGESSSARDSSNVDGLAPWALRRDLEASRARARVMEAELGTCQTEMALLKSKDKIREKKGSYLIIIWKMLSVLWARMREIIRDQVTTSMAEFVANMNHGTGVARAGGVGAGGAGADGAGACGAGVGGARPTAPEITGCTYITFMKCEPHPFKGTEGVVGLCQWFEKLESVFQISDCKEMDKVKFATATLQGRALTWWNGRIASMGIDAANGTLWTEVRNWMTEEFCPRSVLQRLEQELYNLKLKGTYIDGVLQRLEQELYNLKLKGTYIDGYTNRFHELSLLCPRMVEPEQVKVEQYIRGFSKNIRGDMTSSRPAGIDEAVRMAYQLMGKIIQHKTDEASEGEKRKGEGDRGGRSDNWRDYNRRQNQRSVNAGAMTNATPNNNEVCPKCKNKKHGGDCLKCGKCGKLGHKTVACWSLDIKDVTCFNHNEKGHQKRDCPKLKKNGQGGNNRGAVYKLRAVDAC
nr:hypothetical protein [Tanacetum cinerariifolium]